MSETLESYCEYYKRPCTVSDGLCSECGERLIEPASGATEESPKTKGMTNGKQRVEEILQKYSNAVVDEAVEKCVGGGIDGYNQGYAKGKTDGEKIGNTKGRQDMQWHIDNRTGNYD